MEAFLDRRIGYLDIAAIVSEALDKSGSEHLGDGMADNILEQAQEIDRTGRRLAGRAVDARLARGAA